MNATTGARCYFSLTPIVMKEYRVHRVPNFKTDVEPALLGESCSLDQASVQVFRGPEPCRVVEAETGRVLAVYLPRAITDPELLAIGRDLYRYTYDTRYRHSVAGQQTRRVGKDGKRVVGRRIRSGIVGYYGPSYMYPFCRKTVMYARNEEHFNRTTLRLVQYISDLFRRHVPAHYRAQQRFLRDHVNPNMVLPGTVYTTLTVNSDLATRAHRDAGNYDAGLGNIIVFNRTPDADWSGAEFLLPEFRIGFQLREGDVMFVDNTEVHCNAPLVGRGRISLVCYIRRAIADHCTDVTAEEIRRSAARPKRIVLRNMRARAAAVAADAGGG